MAIYKFTGTVSHYGKVIDDHYVAETSAPSAEKALSNLQFKWKRDNGFVSYLKVCLDGKLEVQENKPTIPPRIEDLQESINFD